MPRHPAAFAILVGGGVAGALDIGYAISFAMYRGMTAEHLLQVVASGLLGTAAYDGGTATAALGLACHLAMSFVFAAFFYAVARRWRELARHPWITGPVYGLGVFAVMNFIVLPLSAFPHEVQFSLLGTGTNLLSHLFFFGLPIALATRGALRPR
jgi:uncharacterized membrane protein YagU involved in acid resistance